MLSETMKQCSSQLLCASIQLPCACYYVGSPPKKVNFVQRETQKSPGEFLYRQLNYYLTSVGRLEPIVMEYASRRSLGIITVI